MSDVVISLVLIGLSAGFIGSGWGLTLRLTPERKRRAMLRWLGEWSGKGLVLPGAIWGLMNVGLSWNLQPYMPQLQAAQNSGGPWVLAWVRITLLGFLIISSYWASGTLVWVLVNSSRGVDPEPRSQFKALCLTCVLGLGLPAGLLILFGGWLLGGAAAALLIFPMAGYAPSVLQPDKTPPMYARAVARIKFGKYSEAEWEIIRELEKCEDDFEGWMMLAELYANHFHDLAEAEATILEICDQPRLTPSQLSVALHRLADWQLKLGHNPDAARRALQMIMDRLKGTHLARMAGLRLQQLPKSVEALKEQEQARPIPLPALGDSLDEDPSQKPPLERRVAARLANAAVEELKKDPNDVGAREKLARLFAEQLDRPELGIEQLTLLLDMPDQPENRRAEWMSLIAAWHIKYRHDPEEGRRLLEKLSEQFPGTAYAFAARTRLERMQRGIS